jgi:UDP-2,3-diacylglucosamine pyrophosphatase LpxH
MKLPKFDEIHVISDLHMGGREGFQILKQTGRLAAYIRLISSQKTGRTALILNGDVIDTLAEETGGYIAVDNAESVVQRIITDPSFVPVWDALAEFVKVDDKFLVIVLGNHDLEISFPVVQHLIVDRLAGQDVTARGRVEFSFMGAGYTCLVGDARVFCTHGNEADSWNFVRYEDLAKVGRRLNAGRSLNPREWEPNAGTMLVKDVMNDIKRFYPWIDLLKPETKGAVGVLMAIDPAQAKKLDRILPIIGEKIESIGDMDHRLSAEGFSTPSADKKLKPASVDGLLGASLSEGLQLAQRGNVVTADDLLRAVETTYKTDNAFADDGETTLGIGQYIWDRFKGISKPEALRRALVDWLEDDKSFEIDNRDDTFNQIVPTVGPGIDFIVTGHSHLERAIELGGNRFYFNCGTWIRLLKFAGAMLDDEASFKPVYDLLAAPTMDKIDQAVFGGMSFVLDQLSSVVIQMDGNGVVGRLMHVEEKNGRIELNPQREFKR